MAIVITVPQATKRFVQDPQWNHVFTKLFDSYLSIMQKKLKDNLITLPEMRLLTDNKPYSRWYDGFKFCQYHHVPGHDTEQCICLCMLEI